MNGLHRAHRNVVAGVAAVLLAVGAGAAGAPPAAALSGGSAAPTTWGFVAKLDIGGVRSCTGALINPQWVITAASCFSINGQPVTAGAPPLSTTVTLARPNLATATGRALPAVQVVPNPNRDVALVKLSLQVLDVTPVSLSTTAPATGDAVDVAGYGRTGTTWVPDQLQAVPAAVSALGNGTFAWLGRGVNASACKGDAGGPVFRGGSTPALLGIDVDSWQAGCLAVSDTRYGASAARVDDLKAWITANAPVPSTQWGGYFTSTNGIGGFDLGTAADRVVPFDYDHSGQLDHLLLYRPGRKIVYIVKHNSDGTFTQVFASTNGIGSFDLGVATDRVVAFDYDHSGKQDHLLLYRPGNKIVHIVKHNANNTFSAVLASSTGIGGFDLGTAADQVTTFDFDHSGKLDHLVLYRPGNKIIYIVKHNLDGTFTPTLTSSNGIGSFDLASTADQVVPFDYDHTGKQDHLVLYRAGQRIVHVLKHNTNGTYTQVFNSTNSGVPEVTTTGWDQLLAFDYDHAGAPQYLFLYGPGSKTARVIGRK